MRRMLQHTPHCIWGREGAAMSRFTAAKTSRDRNARPNRLFVFCAVVLLFFLTAAPTPAWALRAVLLSDTQGKKGPEYNHINRKETTAAVKAILAMKPRPDMVFCLGDLVGRGFTERAGYQFEDWKELMRPITQAGIPLYVLKGNHELTCERGKDDHSRFRYFVRNQEAFVKAFSNMPSDGPKGYDHLAYTVADKATSTVFVALDSYYLDRDMESTPYGSYGYISQAQTSWLRGPLPAVDSAAHRIVLTHAPAFNVKKEHPGFVHDSFRRLWEALEEKKFDMMIAAHLHVFSCAGIDESVYPESRRPITQVVIGPVGGTRTAAKSARSDPATWNLSLDRNFLLLEIDGPKPNDPIKLTPYMKNAGGAYAPAAMILVGKGLEGE